MKKLYALCYGVILLCIVGTAILLIFTPDTIPVHYNFAGEVDRFGSKYENLIWPIFTITMGAFFILLAKQKRKKGETVNEKILLYTGICTLLFFAALGFYFMLKAIRYDPDAAATVSIDVMKFTGIAIGILLVILGNIMPKMRRNAMFGLRTKWSMTKKSAFRRDCFGTVWTCNDSYFCFCARCLEFVCDDCYNYCLVNPVHDCVLSLLQGRQHPIN